MYAGIKKMHTKTRKMHTFKPIPYKNTPKKMYAKMREMYAKMRKMHTFFHKVK